MFFDAGTFPVLEDLAAEGDPLPPRRGPRVDGSPHEEEGVHQASPKVKNTTGTVLVLFKTRFVPRHNSRGIFILGQEYVVFPDTFNDFIADYMHKNVAGFASYEEANDKWTSYFNDSRKKEKAKQNVGYRAETPSFLCRINI